MQNFLQTAMGHALEEGAEPDPSAEVWAVRAFSMLSLLGEDETINDEVGGLLARLLGRAPNTVVTASTQNLLRVAMVASEIANTEIPDYPPTD